MQIDPSVKFVIYADDTSLFIAEEASERLPQRSKEVLEKFGVRACCNGSLNNTVKSKAVIFREKGKYVNKNQYLVLNGCPVEIVASIKTLGVVFTEHMLWELHVDQVVNKLSRVTRLL